MSSVWGRLLIAIVKAFDILAGPKVWPTAKNCDSESSLASPFQDVGYVETWADPFPGTKALFGLHGQVLSVGRRDCLSNGSNYCFGNNVDFCPDCGNCCIEGKHCCGRGDLCCGSGCCSSDQTCSQGKCLSAL
jgi:hypothetical protein